MSIPKEDKHHTTALTDIYDAIKGTWSPNEKHATSTTQRMEAVKPRK
jgi:hypothetical protein